MLSIYPFSSKWVPVVSLGVKSGEEGYWRCRASGFYPSSQWYSSRLWESTFLGIVNLAILSAHFVACECHYNAMIRLPYISREKTHNLRSSLSSSLLRTSMIEVFKTRQFESDWWVCFARRFAITMKAVYSWREFLSTATCNTFLFFLRCSEFRHYTYITHPPEVDSD